MYSHFPKPTEQKYKKKFVDFISWVDSYPSWNSYISTKVSYTKRAGKWSKFINLFLYFWQNIFVVWQPMLTVRTINGNMYLILKCLIFSTFSYWVYVSIWLSLLVQFGNDITLKSFFSLSILACTFSDVANLV